jgi:pimeloyl-ACP methyl ester carboxylesterase
MKKNVILLTFSFLFAFCSKNEHIIESEINSTESTSLKNSNIEFVEIGGIDQAIKVDGNDMSKPVLLVLHGGPGYAMLPVFHNSMPELEDHYIVVNWDQRGAGRSYSSSISSSSMTLSQQIADAHELTEMLKDRFNKEKIYILGHSWGTVIGTELINDYPEDYFAYIGVGQVINVIRNEQHCYNLTLAKAREENHQEAIRQLTTIGEINVYSGEYPNTYNGDDGWDVTNKWMEYFGGSLYSETNSDEVTASIVYDDIYKTNTQQWYDGFYFSQCIFEDESVFYFDFSETHLNFSVPVYFFTGKHDFETPYTLAEEYYNAIKSEKHLVWFENSAHFPFYKETSKFVSELIKVSNSEYKNTDQVSMITRN